MYAIELCRKAISSLYSVQLLQGRHLEPLITIIEDKVSELDALLSLTQITQFNLTKIWNQSLTLIIRNLPSL